MSDSDYPVVFASNPNGARIEIQNESGQTVQAGTAPFTATLPASAGFFDAERYTVTASMDGHSEQVMTLSARLDGWYIGNLLFGGLIGLLLVDPATGAMWKLKDRVELNLAPVSS